MSPLPKIYCFDVDHTLAVHGGPYRPGPVQLSDLSILKRAGNIVGLAGNWPVFISLVPNWWDLISFFGPEQPGSNYYAAKLGYLKKLKYFVRASDFIMIGNDPKYFKEGVSNDVAIAKEAGFRFIREADFAEGKR